MNKNWTVIATIDPEDGEEFSVVTIPAKLDLSTIVHHQWYSYAAWYGDEPDAQATTLEEALDLISQVYVIDYKSRRRAAAR